MTFPAFRRLAVVAALFAATASASFAAGPRTDAPVVVAQAQGTTEGELSPRYHPAPVKEKSWYNSDYIFGLTRGVADSTIHPAGKAPLFLFTVPLDLALLPVTVIGGMFG